MEPQRIVSWNGWPVLMWGPFPCNYCSETIRTGRTIPSQWLTGTRLRETILWANDRSRSMGILPGMRHGRGLALSHHLRAGVVSNTAIREAVAALVPRLRRYAPEVEASRDEAGVFWLGASGLSHLYPRLEAWARLIHQELVGTALHSTVAVGFSRFGSYAAAKASDGIVVFQTPGEEHAAIRGVALERIEFAPRVRDLLARLGIHTLGDFLDLPASQVPSRLGPEAYRLHRLAAGDLWSPPQPEAPPEPQGRMFSSIMRRPTGSGWRS